MKITILYKLRRALALGAIAGGTLVACSKENTQPYNIEMPFYSYADPDVASIKKYATMPEVSHIYLIPTGDFEVFSDGHIHLAQKYLEKTIIPIAPTKISGNGKDGFRFGRGYAAKADSLWFEQHGWPVNRNTKQR
ncbi:MAG: hypothetical protein MJY44_04300 [Bacteroidales bacterium]|nr:hypothetical protein [Bacteroidales bacterium]